MSRGASFFSELKRRKVFRAAAFYIAAVFAALQGMDVIIPALHLPGWLMTVAVVVAIVGLPVTLALAWAFDIVPEDATADGEAAVAPRSRTRALRWVIPVLAIVIVATAMRLAWRRIINPHAAINTLAVLPFVNTGGVASDDYFSDGMTDELAHALGRLPGLRIAGRTSSYAFKGRSVGAQDVGRVLDVGAIVTGTVRRAGDRLRVTTQLVGTSDGKILWDGAYESLSSDVFTLQDQFTREIVAALSPALTAHIADTTTARARGTQDKEAYDLYLKGRYYWIERGEANVRRSIQYFQQAITRDPSFARAHAGLALAYAVLPSFVSDVSDSLMTLMMESARRAVALDSTDADGQLAFAVGLETSLRLTEAHDRYRAAAALDPSSATAYHWLGMNLLSLGRTDEAIAELRHATQLDPLAKSPASSIGMALLFARRFPESEAAARRVLQQDSTFPFGLWNLGMVQALSGKADSAVLTLEKATRLYPNAPTMKTSLLFAYAAAGRWTEAARIRDELHLTNQDRSGGVDGAFADLVFGNREPLVRMLTSREGQRRYLQYSNVFGCDPRLDPLWSDTRFRDAMVKLGVKPCTLARPWPLPPRPKR